MQETKQLASRLKTDFPNYPLFFDISLAPFSTFRVGGNAELLLLPRTREELLSALRHAEELQLGMQVLGGGANVLISDRGVRGPVLSLRELRGLEWLEGNTLLRAESGWDMSELCRIAQQKAASGLHFFYGMPGTLGGALYMNARCYEGEISQIVQSYSCIPVSRYDAEGRPIYRAADLAEYPMTLSEWSYKHSPFQKKQDGQALAGSLIIDAVLLLRPSDSASIGMEMQNFHEDRRLKGHYRLPCAGSFFKNNRSFGAPSGKIIDGLGLKGLRRGGAQLAPWHGNIIVNNGNARASEIWELAQHIKAEVEKRQGFALEEEVERLGDWD